MSATIIQGKTIAEALLSDLREQVEALGAPLHLAAIVAGDDPGLRAFVRLKQKAAHTAGIQFSTYVFDADDEAGARQTLAYLAADEQVHGIFVELPLPTGWDRAGFCALIPSEKDVDLLSSRSEQRCADGVSPILPPAALAVRTLLQALGRDVRGARVAVVGQGALIGIPVARWFRQQGAEVIDIDVGTPQPELLARGADIIISGAGVPGLVTDAWVKEGALVLDFGYAKRGNAYVGDVDAASVAKIAGALTPVPGGMGPLVVAAVLENVLTLATRPASAD